MTLSHPGKFLVDTGEGLIGNGWTKVRGRRKTKGCQIRKVEDGNVKPEGGKRTGTHTGGVQVMAK